MNISLSWLKDHIQLTDPVQDIADKLTKSGLEVEGLNEIETVKGGLKGVVIGEVKTCEQHPNADRLRLTTVDIGSETSPIVCGAPNVAVGQKVIVATLGTTLYPVEGDSFQIKKAKIRGEVSEGMLCAEDELGLGKGHDGILVLDTNLPNGTPAAEYFKIESDHVIEIGLTPNRADATSHYGVARELKVLYGTPLKTSFEEQLDLSAAKPIEVIVENNEACPRYAGITIDGLKVEPSPDWLQNRLRAIGLAPINNVVDATNYILHDLGQPLHAFDMTAITTGQVTIKTLPEGTKFTTLDEIERSLTSKDLMICNGDEPMCIAGVFGGQHSGVTNSTTSIFLESAYFSANYVRDTATHHSLKTDASFRFERGTDPEMPVKALIKAANLITEIAGGSISSSLIDVYPTPIKPFDVSVKYKNIDRLIGKKIGNDLIKKILLDLEINIVSENEAELQLQVPAYRVDVQREADIVEEILRIYGYDNIEESDYMSSSFLAPEVQGYQNNKKSEIAQVLADSGFHEIITNSLTKEAHTLESNIVDDNESVHILNKLSEDLDIMRQTPLFTGMEVIAHNLNRKLANLKFFEFAKTYYKTDDGYKERNLLSIFIAGDNTDESWKEKATQSDFHTLKSALGKIFGKLRINQLATDAAKSAIFEQGITLSWNTKSIGHAGLVKPEHRKKIGIKKAVWYAELDLDVLLAKTPKNLKYKELSKFPVVRRDLSLVLDKTVTFEQIHALAQRTERKLLQEVNVFDVYEGAPLKENQKSYSVSFMLQDQNDTLNDKAIDKTMTRFIGAFERELGAIIRK